MIFPHNKHNAEISSLQKMLFLNYLKELILYI